MAISLRTNEEVKITADFHWSTYISVGLWAATLSLAGLGMISERSATPQTSSAIFWTFFIGWTPLLYRLLENRCKHYVVTNQRLYVEDGIIRKRKKDIPLQKVNDFEVSQGIIQRLFGAGTLLVLTGHEKPTRLTNIDNPDAFKNQISEVVGQFAKKAAA